MKIINIGILAHVAAGKTTLTESLLYASGAISEPGSVEKGTTRTDTMFLERQRVITIQAAVTSFQWHRCKVNIVDTPGHMDFLSEVYRSLAVLDGAILVISAKDGVQAQTRILFLSLIHIYGTSSTAKAVQDKENTIARANTADRTFFMVLSSFSWNR